jgi:elongation factor G
VHRLEEAHESEELAQETIIENLDPEEAARLSKVRNIGIAVSITESVDNYCVMR